jgi:hypothetical protein
VIDEEVVSLHAPLVVLLPVVGVVAEQEVQTEVRALSLARILGALPLLVADDTCDCASAIQFCL